MRIEPLSAVQRDDWLEGQCRRVENAGQELAQVVGQINLRTEQAHSGSLGRRRRITDTQMRRVDSAYRVLHDVMVAIQNALFDCEHELRSLRERELSPAELLVEGERLIRQYRFLRRRARVIDGLLAYLPMVTHDAGVCREHLRQLQVGADLPGPLRVPDCTFALVALEQLREEEARPTPRVPLPRLTFSLPQGLKDRPVAP